MIHPVVQAALDSAYAFRHSIDDMAEQIDRIRVRRPSPHGLVIPEVDGVGRLTDLYIAPGTIEQFDNEQVAAEIMAAIRESTADAERRHRIAIEEALSQMDSRGTDTVSGI